MRRGEAVVAAWAAFLGALTVLLVVYRGSLLPVVLFGSVAASVVLFAVPVTVSRRRAAAGRHLVLPGSTLPALIGGGAALCAGAAVAVTYWFAPLAIIGAVAALALVARDQRRARTLA